MDCGWIYDESVGIPSMGIRPGTTWEELPADFKCPECDTLKKQTDLWQVID